MARQKSKPQSTSAQLARMKARTNNHEIQDGYNESNYAFNGELSPLQNKENARKSYSNLSNDIRLQIVSMLDPANVQRWRIANSAIRNIVRPPVDPAYHNYIDSIIRGLGNIIDKNRDQTGLDIKIHFRHEFDEDGPRYKVCNELVYAKYIEMIYSFTHGMLSFKLDVDYPVSGGLYHGNSIILHTKSQVTQYLSAKTRELTFEEYDPCEGVHGIQDKYYQYFHGNHLDLSDYYGQSNSNSNNNSTNNSTNNNSNNVDGMGSSSEDSNEQIYKDVRIMSMQKFMSRMFLPEFDGKNIFRQQYTTCRIANRTDVPIHIPSTFYKAFHKCTANSVSVMGRYTITERKDESRYLHVVS